MEQSEERLRQRRMIRKFEEQLYKTVSDGMEPVTKLGVILFEVLITGILCIPFSTEDMRLFSFCSVALAPWPVWLYMNRLLLITEGGKTHRIADKLRYLPVDRRELWHVHLEYLVRFLRLPLFCGVAAQVLVAFLANHRLTVWNLLCPLLVAGVCPFLVGLVLIHERK